MNLVHLQVLDGAVSVWFSYVPPIWWFSGQPTAGSCEIITMDHDSSQPRRTIARQTARCTCRKGQIAGTRRARPACVDGETSCGVWLRQAINYQSSSPSWCSFYNHRIFIHLWDLQAVKVCKLMWRLVYFLSSHHLAPSLVWHDSLFRWWRLRPPGQSVGLELHTAGWPGQENHGKMRTWRGTSSASSISSAQHQHVRDNSLSTSQSILVLMLLWVTASLVGHWHGWCLPGLPDSSRKGVTPPDWTTLILQDNHWPARLHKLD